MSASETERIDDPESYVNERRLQQVFDLRERIHNRRLEAKALDEEPGIRALSAYRTLVNSYIVEVEPLLRKYDGGADLLYEHDFGQHPLTPKVERVGGRHGRDTWKVYTDDGEHLSSVIPEGETFHFRGLIDLLQQPDPLQTTVLLRTNAKHGKDKVEPYPISGQVKFPLLDDMVRAINNFLADIGFEIEPQDEQEAWEI